MKQFFRGGRGLLFGQSGVRPLADEYVNVLSSYQDLSSRPIEEDTYLISTNRSSRRYTPFRSKSGTRHDDGVIVRHTAYSLKLIAVTIFCVLFGSALAQSRDSLGTAVQGSNRPYDFSLYAAAKVWPMRSVKQKAKEWERYPKVDFKKFPQELFDVEPALLPKIQIGEKLPDVVLDMPLRVVNDAYARDTITLRSCMDRPWIILDIWTEWCAPCIGSMNKWEELSRTDESFTLLGIYSSPETHRAMPESRKKGYLSTQVIGPATYILGYLFFHSKYSLGPSIWIKDGRLFGISQAGTLQDKDYRLLLDGKLDAIPAYAQWKPITH